MIKILTPPLPLPYKGGERLPHRVYPRTPVHPAGTPLPYKGRGRGGVCNFIPLTDKNLQKSDNK